jgi:hypothetical protein
VLLRKYDGSSICRSLKSTVAFPVYRGGIKDFGACKSNVEQIEAQTFFLLRNLLLALGWDLM